MLLLVFGFALPKFAQYDAVIDSLGELSGREIVVLPAVAALNLVTYWWVYMAALPHLSLRRAGMAVQTNNAAFAFTGLATSVPITPGGIGVAEVAYVGLLTHAGGQHAKVGAAVLLFRVLTYLVQIRLPPSPISCGTSREVHLPPWKRHRPAEEAPSDEWTNKDQSVGRTS